MSSVFSSDEVAAEAGEGEKEVRSCRRGDEAVHVCAGVIVHDARKLPEGECRDEAEERGECDGRVDGAAYEGSHEEHAREGA